MNADLRCLSVVVLLLALMGSDLAAEPPVDAEKKAIAAIKALRGGIRRSKGHVSNVNLNATQVTDAELVHLKGMTK